MDMFAPSTYEFALNRAQEPVAPASGASAEDGEEQRRFASSRRWVTAYLRHVLLSDHAGCFPPRSPAFLVIPSEPALRACGLFTLFSRDALPRTAMDARSTAPAVVVPRPNGATRRSAVVV